MQPADADGYFGQVLHGAARGTRRPGLKALKAYFLFLELRHKVDIYDMNSRARSAACPVDGMSRPRGSEDAALRIPPSEAQVGMLFAGWRGELLRTAESSPWPRELRRRRS